jgi:uncharacterized Zn finger protein (UPF0148 family)
MTSTPEFPPVTVDIAKVVCPVCHWTANISRQAYMSQEIELMKQLDLASQRRIDDALAEHLRSEHGLMSVLQHTWEMNQQADRSFREGMKEGETKLESGLRKVVLQAMRDALTPVLDPDDIE